MDFVSSWTGSRVVGCSKITGGGSEDWRFASFRASSLPGALLRTMGHSCGFEGVVNALVSEIGWTRVMTGWYWRSSACGFSSILHPFTPVGPKKQEFAYVQDVRS